MADPPLHDLVQPDECAAADEQDIGGVHLDERLVRVLASAFGRHVGNGPFEDLQQGLLDAFAGNIARDGNVFAFLGDLVDLIDVNDADLGLFDIEIGGLKQAQDNVFDVFADISGFGQSRGVGNAERHVEHPCQGPGDKGLAGPGGADQQDVAFFDLHIGEILFRGLGCGRL